MMRLLLIALLIASICCAGQKPALIVSTDSVPPKLVNDPVFQDLISAPGGVGSADNHLFPDVSMRELIKVELLDVSGDEAALNMRWFVQHDGDATVSYFVRCVPNQDGQINFFVTPELPGDSEVLKKAVAQLKLDKLRSGIGKFTLQDVGTFMGEPLATDQNEDGRSSAVYQILDTQAIAVVFGTDGRLEKVGVYEKTDSD